ncbi:diguanylate cyclase [Methylomonas methanica]|jgi:diguanylate cyclase (GGDEF)-like protein/PAS domain S-box-containing protein|uniref:Diguanylate cyclase n=2 Tax=Methylomonas methanica TaxID=421 RepID=A0A177M9E3_METMH|nr:diguanylate cyclase [Methylomonas methanica]
MPPLTGVVEMYGTEIIHAARIACDEINQRGGLLGRPTELIVEDDGSLPQTAVPAARRLVKDHRCVAIIGNLLSSSRIAVADQVAKPEGIPYLNFSFYEGSIFSRYFFHFAALPNQQIDKMIPYMAKHYGLKMFFAGNNYEWPRGSIDAAKRCLHKLDGDVVGEEYLPIGASLDEINALLELVARSGADVFVPYFAGMDQIRLLTRFTEMGLKKHMAVVMGHFDEVLASQLSAQVREGFYSSNTYFMSLDTQENQTYFQKLAAVPGIDGIWPNGNGMLTNFGEATYLCVKAFAKAVEQAGSTDSEALVDALETISVSGPQGIIKMDASTHHAWVNTYLSRCNANGSFSIVESFNLNPPSIPERYRRQSVDFHISSPPRHSKIKAQELATSTLTKLNAAQQILSIADMAILATDENGIITEANVNACKLFGYSGAEILGMSVHLLLPPHFRQRHAELVTQFIKSDETQLNMSGRGELTGYRKDGSFFPLEASVGKVRLDESWMLVVTLCDISTRKQAEEELLWRATHDSLTGLPNRALIRERLTNALQRTRRHGANVGLLFIDLDDFKSINDTYGHEMGDLLLKTIAARLIELIRPGDTLARLAGDEFVVLCEQIEQPTSLSLIAERINAELRQCIELNGHSLYVTTSIGIAAGHGSTHSTDDLLRYADTAMYEVKQKGRDGWHFFNDSLEQKVRQRLSVTQGLRLAIERNELSPRFQPIVTADSGRIIGAELLLRWFPEEGEISPAIFIPIAELTGAIIDLGLWVFRQACRSEFAWRQRWQRLAPAYISVNVSARQLNEESLADDFAKILQETCADPRRILLEITETSLMADIETNLRVLRRLADLGMGVAVDDFGTGYSSLAQLTRLPVNVLKIDRAFVNGIDTQPENRAVNRAIVGLARALGLKLVAEGVENVEQLLELRALGCDYIQGYLFHRPLEEQSFIDRFSSELDIEQSVAAAEPPLFFLIYVSKATQCFTDIQLNTLLEKTRTDNNARGITGCLLYMDGCFMQILEGSRRTVLGLVEKIKRDPRHRDFQLVMQAAQQRRIFPDWSMGFRDLTRLNNEPDFTQWRKRSIDFFELAEDARTCYTYITAFKHENF